MAGEAFSRLNGYEVKDATARELANTAKSTADTAKSTADTAKQQATTAQTAAQNAQTTANTANGKTLQVSLSGEELTLEIG